MTPFKHQIQMKLDCSSDRAHHQTDFGLASLPLKDIPRVQMTVVKLLHWTNICNAMQCYWVVQHVEIGEDI